MFVVDFIAASVLALVLTVAFTALVRNRRYRRVSDMSGNVWLMAVASWIGGILVVGCGLSLTGTHWLPFAVSGFLIGLLVLTLPGLPKLETLPDNDPGHPGADAQPVIAMYFFVTLLLFFCAISVHFYMVNLA
jgi:hypothetical protein